MLPLNAGINAGNRPWLSTGDFPHTDFCDLRDYARMKIRAEDVANRAIELATQKRLTEREASIDAVGKPDLIRDMKRGRMPGGDRLRALADTLDTTVDFLLGKVPSSLRPGAATPLVSFDRLPEDVPVLGTAMGADLEIEHDGEVIHVEQTILELTETRYFVRRMPGIAGDKEAYSLDVVGNSMAARYEDGDPIYVTPNRSVGIGDYVVVQIADPSSEGVIAALVKKLVGRSSTHYELEQFNPPLRFKIALSRVARIHHILTPRELAGR